MALEIKRLVNHPIDSNCYIIFDKLISNECVIVDPGSDNNDALYEIIDELSLAPQYIILTHEHFDHCWGVNALKEKYPNIKLVCSLVCSVAIQNARLNYSHYYCRPEFSIVPADVILENNNWSMVWNGYNIAFSPARGHSSSGIFFIIGNSLFTGDTLIKDEKTIIKFKTGSFSELKSTFLLFEKFKGKGYVVYPGHGTTFNLDYYNLNISL